MSKSGWGANSRLLREGATLLLDLQEVLWLEVGTFFALDESPIVGETWFPMGEGFINQKLGTSGA